MSRNLSDLRLWIFDMDDTLYPEREFVLGGYRAVSRVTENDFGISIEDALIERFERGQRNSAFNLALKDKGIDPTEDYIKVLVYAYREHIPHLTPYPDVLPLLEKLRSQSKQIALLSDGLEAVQRRKWDALGLTEFFDLVVFTESLGGPQYWKPSPKGFELALKGLEVEPRHAVYVGDNPLKDFQAPRMLGMKSIRIIRPEGQHRNVAAMDPSFEADFSIQSLSQL